MKWMVLLMAVVMVLLAWWVRQPEPDVVWSGSLELPAKSILTESPAITNIQPETVDVAAQENIGQSSAPGTGDIEISDWRANGSAAAATSLDCPSFATLEEHPSSFRARDWLRHELLFYNWAEEHYLQLDEAAMLLEAQAGNALAMRALAIYYAAPMVRPEFNEQDPSDAPAPEYSKARFWLYQAALHDVPMMFAFQAFTYLDELTAFDQHRDQDGNLAEPYYSESRQLLIMIHALTAFDLWVTPVLETVRTGSPLFGLADVELTAQEQQQLAEQLTDLQSEWRFHRSQRGQSERIDIQMPPDVATWFELVKEVEQCYAAGDASSRQ